MINYHKPTWENHSFSNGCKSHSIVHGLHLNGAGALLVDQVVVERWVRALVAEEVVRQLDLDLLRTHDYHFVEQTNRHLWERLGVMKRVIFDKIIDLQKLRHAWDELGNSDFKEKDGAEDGLPTLGEIKD